MRNFYRRLVRGVHSFYTKCNVKDKVLLRRLAKHQNPHVLFITCADSRIVPSLITGADFGELFILRNVGNIVPPYVPDRVCSEAAGLEFALLHLNINDIIICGHSNCGAIGACCGAEPIPGGSHLKLWIEAMRASLSFDSKMMLDDVAKLHVLQQIKNLQTYPLIQRQIESGNLKLHAWFFNIATALICVWDEKTNTFSKSV